MVIYSNNASAVSMSFVVLGYVISVSVGVGNRVAAKVNCYVNFFPMIYLEKLSYYDKISSMNFCI